MQTKQFHPGTQDKPYFIPLFWQKQNSREAIETEMRKMKAVGINAFVAEPRPHPEYLEKGWWDDIDFMLELCRELDMYMYFFDDGLYPSGTANGRLAQLYPEATKRFINERHIDAAGPLPHAHFLVDDWMMPGEKLLAVVACRRVDHDNTMASDTLVDITDHYRHGRVYWPVPEGEYRIFIIKETPYGEEEHTRNYCNPLKRDAVRRYIDIVHEAHYARYKDEFGRRIKGFFTDEPRFGNTIGYERIIGLSPMPLPYSDELPGLLGKSPLGDFTKYLPLLWFPDDKGVCRDVRYLYMDVVSRLFAENFTGQLGDWCRDHNVELIGHVVEENGAHARLGYGAGHYFRAMKGLDMSGIDVVCNMLPGHTEGRYSTMFNYFDVDFNLWGLPKMAASAAHVDPKKKNRALCEAFGAYGWSEGLKAMKWITDAMAVRGIGILTPHAFSPDSFPDADCPPHFYARGENPQFRYFDKWSHYALRLSDAIYEADHIADAAVLYHAEGEWGTYFPWSRLAEPFEKAVRALAENQIDCDVVAIDDLLEAKVEKGLLKLGREAFKILIIPYTPSVTREFLTKLQEFKAGGLNIVFTGGLPEHIYFEGDCDCGGFECAAAADIPALMRERGLCSVYFDKPAKDLIVTHYAKEGIDRYLIVNQNVNARISGALSVRSTGRALLYDAMEDRFYEAAQTACGEARGKASSTGEYTSVKIELEPWESVFLAFGDEATACEPKPTLCGLDGTLEIADWKISVANSRDFPAFTETPFRSLCDLSLPEYLPDFTGTVRYEASVPVPGGIGLRGIEADGNGSGGIGADCIDPKGPVFMEITEAFEAVDVAVNGIPAGVKITPPYVFEIPAEALEAAATSGMLEIRIDVTNTVVKESHNNVFDPFFAQDGTGIAGKVVLRFR